MLRQGVKLSSHDYAMMGAVIKWIFFWFFFAPPSELEGRKGEGRRGKHVADKKKRCGWGLHAPHSRHPDHSEARNEKRKKKKEKRKKKKEKKKKKKERDWNKIEEVAWSPWRRGRVHSGKGKKEGGRRKVGRGMSALSLSLLSFTTMAPSSTPLALSSRNLRALWHFGPFLSAFHASPRVQRIQSDLKSHCFESTTFFHSSWEKPGMREREGGYGTILMAGW